MRRLLKVQIEDEITADQISTMPMGMTRNRRAFIELNTLVARDIDV